MAAKLSEREAKRQLSFLNSFERKFQVLRREIQRLERVRDGGSAYAGNWPTDGLERTAKSLVGAGAMYGIKDISAWAKEFLVGIDALHGNVAPPSQTNMAWLSEQLETLIQLHGEAVARVEAALSSAPQEKTSELHSPLKQRKSNISKNSVGEANKKAEIKTDKKIDQKEKSNKGLRNKANTVPEKSVPLQKDGESADIVNDRDTMPVDIDEIIDLAGNDSFAATPPPPPIEPPATRRTAAQSRFPWPIIAVVLVLLLGVSVYFNLAGTFAATQRPSSADSQTKAATKKKEVEKKTIKASPPAADISTDESDIVEGIDSENANSGAENDSSRVAKHAVGSEKVDDRQKKNAPVKPSPKAVFTNDASSASKSVANRVKPTTPVTASAEPTGTLKVLAAQGAAGGVQIFVDGTKRGKAPRTLKLSPGLHEITFVNGGKRSLKMVSIKEGVAKEVTPKF